MLRGRRRARGRRDVAIGDETVPMRATKGCQCPSCRRQRRAHPRSRGENPLNLIPDVASSGSSPLTRGKRAVMNHPAAAALLIPAHAGKTRTRRSPPARPSAHPRSRGENHRLKVDAGGRVGSSPLTRGKLPAASAGAGSRGLIPAHAGKTSSTPEMRCERTAHPRSRGENAQVCDHPCLASGSSPLTRGKPIRAEALAVHAGLIPAHAGKTSLN